MKILAYTALVLSCTALVMSTLVYFSVKEQDTYAVQSYQYFSDNEVQVIVLLASGHTEKYWCAFPPNTDYQHMKKIKLGRIKTESLLSGPIYYCNAK